MNEADLTKALLGESEWLGRFSRVLVAGVDAEARGRRAPYPIRLAVSRPRVRRRGLLVHSSLPWKRSGS